MKILKLDLDYRLRLVAALPVVMATTAIVLVIVVTLGVWLNTTIFRAFLWEFPKMTPSTAAMITAVALVLLLNQADTVHRYRKTAAFCAVITIILSASYLINIANTNYTVNHWLRAPADATSLTLMLLGIIAILLQMQKIFNRVIVIISIFAILLPIHRLLTFAIGVSTLQSGSFFGSMSLTTAIGLFSLAIGLFMHPRLPYAMQIVADNLQGRILRAILPWTLLVPTFLAVVFMSTATVGEYYSEFMMVTVIAILTMMTTTLLWNLTNRLQISDDRRQIAESTLLETDFRANQIIERSPDAMLVVDEIGRIERINVRMEQLFGYERSELLGQSVEMLIPERFRTGHAEAMYGYIAVPKARFMGEGRNLFARRKDGTEVAVEIGLAPLETPNGVHVLANIVDITERLRTQAEIETALQEKTLLLNEIQQIIERAPDAMLVVDELGCIERINARMVQLFGYDREQLLGQSVEVLIPERFRAGHGDSMKNYFMSPKARFMGEGRDLFARRRDGSEVAVEIGLAPLETPKGLRVLANIVDISGRLRAQSVIESALREKTLLLNEIHHRVKNNLQIVASLLNLQAGRVSDPIFSELIAESEGRVRAMALMHQVLYERKDFARVELDVYLQRLSELLGQINGAARRGIVVRTHLKKLTLDLVRAIPLGLIVNELLSNIFKHAFPNGGGDVYVELIAKNASEAILVVRDNGRGIPADFSLEQSKTLGMQIVFLLAEQIGAVLVIDGKAGTRFELHFTPLIADTADTAQAYG